MFRASALALLTLCLFAIPAANLALPANETAPSVLASGLYVEARNCDVWTGPCFANADFNLTGKNAVLAWKVEKGTAGGVRLDGLSIVAIIVAHNTLGLEQNGPAKAVLI